MADKPDRHTAETMAKLGQERQATQQADTIDMRLRLLAADHAVKIAISAAGVPKTANAAGGGGGSTTVNAFFDVGSIARNIYEFLTERRDDGQKAQD